MAMILVPCYLTKEQKQNLDKLSKRTLIPRAAFIRQGLDLVLKKHKDLLTKHAGEEEGG